MNPPTETCICGRSFSQLNALRKHEHLCQKSRKRLSSALSKARALWPGRKRRHASTPEEPSAPATSRQTLDTDAGVPVNSSTVEEDIHAPIAKRRPQRLRVLPKRFRDILPEPSPVFPPIHPDHPGDAEAENALPSSSFLPHAQNPTRPLVQRIGSRLRRLFSSPRNVFGLSRQYYGHEPPFHDPEESITLSDLCSSPVTIHNGAVPLEPSTAPSLVPQSFYPYPNENSFRLGNWYWNGGVQKSQESFKELLNIVGNPRFQSADVQETKWAQINATLGQNEFDGEEWEDDDAGWIRTSVNISVPFHRRSINPGPKNYAVADFYRRSLVTVIREKLANPVDDRQFHYEPYEVHWKPSGAQRNVRVQGELYTSPAFVDAHRELQEGPGEPGCDLPRAIVALMFWSDSTHLTSFGDSKLWPLYMFFGNESKYRRCKPSSHLCSHVAYFQKVSQRSFIPFRGCSLLVFSYQMNSRILRRSIWVEEVPPVSL
jgi:hypothetical protein